MGAIFSHHHRHHNKKKPPPKVHVTDHDRAVLDLKTAKDRLKRYQVKMRAESSRLTAQATELVQTGRKDRALLVLKMRRLREEESQKAEAQLLNVEKLITQVEWETEQLKVFDALKSGNRVLEEIHSIMSIEAVEKLMADTQDAIEYEQEVSQLLSTNLSSVSEEEVLKEFAALEATLVEPGAAAVEAEAAKPTEVEMDKEKEQKPEAESAIGAPAVAAEKKPLDLPAVPTHPLPAVVGGEEESAAEEATEMERRQEKVAVMTG